jgi:hypothetical protein
MNISQNAYPPENILEKGEMLGFEYIITHNGGGARCGYIKVNQGHPWHGRDFAHIACTVHGSLTFSEQEREGSGWWVGFDFAHPFDQPDPDLPYNSEIYKKERFSFSERLNENRIPTHLWTQDEARNECMVVAVQAAKAAAAPQNSAISVMGIS